MKKKQYDDDDGRTIADMSFTDRPFYGKTRKTDAPREKKEDVGLEKESEPPLTKVERRTMMFAALKAALLIGLVFIAGAALLILFCIYVWFK